MRLYYCVFIFERVVITIIYFIFFSFRLISEDFTFFNLVLLPLLTDTQAGRIDNIVCIYDLQETYALVTYL